MSEKKNSQQDTPCVEIPAGVRLKRSFLSDAGAEKTRNPGKEEKTESELAKMYFLARMSHEMRTPLNAIIGMVTIAQTSDDLGKMAECLTKINEASMQLLAMINDILDIAKIAAGNFSLSCAEFELLQMVRKAACMRKFMMDAKKQNFKLVFDPSLPGSIVSDEHRLTQVLDNLLSNAIKFTPPEGTVTLYAKKIKEEGQTCTLQMGVRDTGIGIPPAGLEKIFSAFEQVDGGISRKYGGTGLGLPICASIVRLLGGELKVDSELRKGSDFNFEITVKTGAAKAGGFTPGENAGTSANGSKSKYEGKSILIAEDVEINREIVLALLEDTGALMECAENGLQAFELFRASPAKFSAVLMDIHMPEMDGYEAARRIRALENERNRALEGCAPRGIPIIAMTANVFKDDIEKCIAAGMNGHLGKPLDFEELIQKLDSVLL